MKKVARAGQQNVMRHEHKRNNIVVIAETERIETNPYGRKVLAALRGAGVKPEFWGCGHKVNCSSRGFFRACHKVLWIAATFWRTLRRADSSTVIVSINSTSAFGPALAALLKRAKLVYVNNDNVALSYRLPAPVSTLVDFIERVTARLSVVHVVPSRRRWKGYSKNLLVVRNVPASEVVEQGRALARNRGYARDGTLTLYVNGWLTKTRGLQTILDAVRMTGVSGLRVIVAGKALCEAAEELVNLPGVEYHGALDVHEAFALYYRADLVATYYDPQVPINRLAESNKWYDCFLTGAAFVVNSEVKTARPYIEAGMCFSAPYSDAQALADLLGRLRADPGALARTVSRAATYPISGFEEEFAPALRAVGVSMCDVKSSDTPAVGKV